MLKVLGVLVIFLVCVNAVDVSKHLEKYERDIQASKDLAIKNLENFRKEIENHGVFEQCWDTDIFIFSPEEFGLTHTYEIRSVGPSTIIGGVQNICIPPRTKTIMGEMSETGSSLQQFINSPNDRTETKNLVKFFESLGFLTSNIQNIDGSSYEINFSVPE